MQTEKKTFRTMTVKEKIEHIWEYYKLALFGFFAAIALLIYGISHLLFPDPEILLNVVLVNTGFMDEPEQDAFLRYLTEQGYDPERETISVNTGLYMNLEAADQTSAISYQAIAAMLLTGDLDLLVGNEDVISLLGSGGGLSDLQELLPGEVLAKHQEQLYLMTGEESRESYVGGIWLTEGNPLMQDGYYEVPTLAAIPYSSGKQELAAEVMLYLLGE